MSAPNAGRQSPEPEQQDAKQQSAPTANPGKQGAGPEEGSQQASKDQLAGLESNPTGPLDQAAKDKTSKTM
jgi:hypothetical protein